MYGTPKLPPFSSLRHSNAGFGIWGVWSHAHASNTPKTLDMCKKSTPCLIQKASRCVSDHTSKTTMLFIFHFLYNTKILRENHAYLFFISLVQWWKLYYIFIFFTKRTTDFNRIKRNMNDETIVFLTSLLIIVAWKILLLFSFQYKIISYFK